MAGTIVVDRIESDASYASSINVANRITFSNTVNFGVTSGAPVAGFYSPSTNNLAFTTASTERMRITSAGDVLVGSASNPFNSKLYVNGTPTANAPIASFYSQGNSNTSGIGLYNDAASVGIWTSSGNLIFRTNGNLASGSETMRIDSSGNVGIGTGTIRAHLDVNDGTTNTNGDGLKQVGITGVHVASTTSTGLLTIQSNNALAADVGGSIAFGGRYSTGDTAGANWAFIAGLKSVSGSGDLGGYLQFSTRASSGGISAERMRIDESGRIFAATTSTNLCAGDIAGIGLNTTINGTYAPGAAQFSASGTPGLNVNRKTDDGSLVTFSQAGTAEGTISVSGTTVSYNGGHLSRYAQITTAKDNSLVKGTVLSNLDEMNVYTDADGNPVDNEQLNKVKVSDVEGDANIAGVFVNWLHDDAHDVDEINMAMTGDMIIRIAQGVTVHRGDLLMSAGDGTAKPQGDDIVRSKTVAKVTSTHVTCTYADGSFCVPCVLMAC
jgi:hypothetical protein